MSRNENLRRYTDASPAEKLQIIRKGMRSAIVELQGQAILFTKLIEHPDNQDDIQNLLQRIHNATDEIAESVEKRTSQRL